MARMEQIDRSRAVTITGHKTVQHTDQCFVDLAKRMQLPQLLNCDVAVGLPKVVDAELGASLLDRLSGPRWRALFEADLQCICEDADGNPLLTTWMSIDVFSRFASSLDDMSVRIEFEAAISAWEAQGVETVYIDAYQRR
ncbi:hypothetical protein [Burkholderia arboris]|uniref:hypothetical protein n=1 Tax=Burkholderia arboris TaxID=488730 RepID=UPI001CF0E973|nr:hypothetical protein [Burkholderia arboris]MCA8050704.1 hypothetical protein [Burkholderia arboris]